jgi:hypothetical protein
MTNSYHGALTPFQMLVCAAIFLAIGVFNIWIGRRLGMHEADGSFEHKFMYGTIPRLTQFSGVISIFLSAWLLLRSILGR